VGCFLQPSITQTNAFHWLIFGFLGLNAEAFSVLYSVIKTGSPLEGNPWVYPEKYINIEGAVVYSYEYFSLLLRVISYNLTSILLISPIGIYLFIYLLHRFCGYIKNSFSSSLAVIILASLLFYLPLPLDERYIYAPILLSIVSIVILMDNVKNKYFVWAVNFKILIFVFLKLAVIFHGEKIRLDLVSTSRSISQCNISGTSISNKRFIEMTALSYLGRNPYYGVQLNASKKEVLATFEKLSTSEFERISWFYLGEFSSHAMFVISKLNYGPEYFVSGVGYVYEEVIYKVLKENNIKYFYSWEKELNISHFREVCRIPEVKLVIYEVNSPRGTSVQMQ
jgi:hypothetical protein